MTYKMVCGLRLAKTSTYNSELTHLISIAPEVVLGSEVLVWVLGTLLQRLHVIPMGPMGIPENLCIDTGNYQAWNRGTNRRLALHLHI